jgi:acetyltransferase-like isoleucine patch superfamily enzyme
MQMDFIRSHIKKFPFILLYPILYKVSVAKSVVFNLNYFPFKIAIRFPVILHRGVKLKKLRGTVELNCAQIKPGLVHLGRSVYGFHTRHHLTIWEQRGGKVVFGENVCLGRGTFISVGYNGNLNFGDNVRFGGNSKIICRKSIHIGERTMVSWDAQIIDTDFHSTLNTIFKTRNRAESSITIGSHNWIGFGCTLLKGSITPDHCIVGANTSLKSDYSKSGKNIVLAYEQNAKVTVKYITFDERSEAESLEEFPGAEPEFQIGKPNPTKKQDVG